MSEFEERIKKDSAHLAEIKAEVSKAIVGQKKVVEGVMRALLSNGSVLLEGVPGTAKTMLMRTVSQVMGCAFSRIQFTPDLLPSDILGITAYEKERGFYVLKGPIFSNIVLADEINRAPPKVQSALLEAMQEKQATIGRETFPISPPFFVLATQNPIESLGTYPLPEAQIDRFIYKLTIGYPSDDEEEQVLDQNMTTRKFEAFQLKRISSPQQIIDMQEDVKNVYADKKIKKYIVQIVSATRYPHKFNLKLGKYVEWGASPRASIALYISSKADALMEGKSFVTPNNVKRVAADVLRHRIIINYEGQSEGVNQDQIIQEILSRVPVP
ncbi:MAG TPA: MoxR family ATPase [Candidatus Nanoarchaeia archaeon]|nr:MoxR family ATPase [Candidatus Nanoarchaeia archaeon]